MSLSPWEEGLGIHLGGQGSSTVEKPREQGGGRQGSPRPVEAMQSRVKQLCSNNDDKEIEENHRMGKTKDLFKKIRDTKGTFNAKMGLIKYRNGMDLKQKILRTGGKNTQKNCTKKIFMTQRSTMV